MNTNVRTCCISMRGAAPGVTVALLVIAGLFVGTPAMARDRPGTPNEVSVSIKDVNRYAKQPTLLVAFNNTAAEEVSFWVEWTANGEPRPLSFGREFVECPVAEPTTYSCARDFLRVERGGKVQTGSPTDQNDVPLAFYVSDVDFDTDYCFRFMAQDTDGVISEIWSAWACRRTPALPELPEKPQITGVTVLPGRDGKGEIGGPVPGRVLVEWARESQRAVHYVVQQLYEKTGWASVSGEVVPPSELEAAVKVAELPTMEHPALYRVCAVNIAGQACSDSLSTKTYAAEQQVDPDLVVQPREPAADTRLPSDAVVAPPSDPISEAPAKDSPYVEPTAPRAETMRRGPYGVPVNPPDDPR